MPRHFSSVLDVKKGATGWTVLVQVVERSHIQTTRSTPIKRMRRFLLTDSEGTKVSAVMYDNCIRLFFNMLWPFKRYYISNAALTDTPAAYRVSSYEYSWIINYTTLVENYIEPVPPTLSCTFDITKFSELHKYADTDTLQNIKALVIHAFPQKEQGSDSTSRDFVVVNDEKKLMLLTLWNEFEDTEGNKIAAAIATVPLIIAMRVKVTTFNSLSLTSRLSSSFLIDPPLAEEMQLKEWYNANKEDIKKLFEAKSYKNPSFLLPPPKEEEIIGIGTLLSSFDTKKTAWVQASMKLAYGQTKYWYIACMNCHKSVNADMDWNITCPSCKENTQVVLRCRIGVVLTDLTGTLNCVISGEDAEKLVPFTSIQLKEANENGIPIDQELAEAIKKHTIVCFLRTYDSDFQGQIQKRNSALKVYTLEDLQHHSSNLITYLQISGLLEQPATPAGKQEKNKGKYEFFSPTTKLVLEEITSVSSATPKASPSAHGVKRSLSFIGQHPQNESASAKATPPATEECSTHQPPEPTSTEPMPTDPDVKPSPSEKHKDD